MEYNPAQVAQLLERSKQAFIESRLLIQQWCISLVNHYNSATEDVRAQLPPLPGTTPETMLPSLYVTNPQDLDEEQYAREAAVLQDIQQAMYNLYLPMNQERLQQFMEGIK